MLVQQRHEIARFVMILVLTIWLGMVLFSVMPGEATESVVKIATYTATWPTKQFAVLQNEIVPSIENKYPGIKIKAEILPDYWTKLRLLVAAGQPPDIFDTSAPLLYSFVLAGATVNLDPYIKRDIDMNDYFAALWDDTRYPYKKGSIYAVPYSWVCSLLYYNVDLFDSCGLVAPDETWNWDSLLTAAKKLTKDTNSDGKIDQWGFDFAYGNPTASSLTDFYNIFDPMVRSFGGEILDADRSESRLDNPGAKKALQFLVDAIHKYKVAPPPGVTGNFPTGSVGMTVRGSWYIDYYRSSVRSFNWDVAIMPKGPHSRVIYGGADCWGVLRRPGQDMNTVWVVLKELISERVQGLCRGGRAPILRSASASFVTKWLEPGSPPKHKQVMLQSAPYIQGADFNPLWDRWLLARDKELAAAIWGEKSVEAAISAAHSAINQVLREGSSKK